MLSSLFFHLFCTLTSVQLWSWALPVFGGICPQSFVRGDMPYLQDLLLKLTTSGHCEGVVCMDKLFISCPLFPGFFLYYKEQITSYGKNSYVLKEICFNWRLKLFDFLWGFFCQMLFLLYFTRTPELPFCSHRHSDHSWVMPRVMGMCLCDATRSAAVLRAGSNQICALDPCTVHRAFFHLQLASCLHCLLPFSAVKCKALHVFYWIFLGWFVCLNE